MALREFEKEIIGDILYASAWWLIALLILLAVLWFGTAQAHEAANWIREQALRNQAGDWCCGEQDCAPIDSAKVHETPNGYRVESGRPGGDEIIPYSEAMPLSPDNHLWICRRQDGSRRCVFNRPGST